MEKLRIVLGCDHGGLEYKNLLKSYLQDKGYVVIDVGTDSKESCHYPIFGFAAAEKVRDKEADFGIVICTSGEGIAIAANKVKGVRCGIGYNDEVSKLMRQHNNANMISFGQNFLTSEELFKRVDIFLTTSFEGGRHKTRVDLIDNYNN